MTTKEKLRAFNSMQDVKFMFADIALLEELNPKSEALEIQAAPSRKNGEILYALLDEASIDEIKENRVKLSKALEEQNEKDAEDTRLATEKAEKAAKELKEKEEKELLEIHNYLRDNKVQFNAKHGIKKMRALKLKTEKIIEESITPEERKKLADEESGKIRDFLTANNVTFNKQLGLKKLRLLKENTEKVEAKFIKSFLTTNNVSFPAEITLDELRDLNESTIKDLNKAAESGSDADLDEKKEETTEAPEGTNTEAPADGDKGDSAEKKN